VVEEAVVIPDTWFCREGLSGTIPMDPVPSDRNLLWFPLCRVNQISPTHCFQTWERSNHIIKISPVFAYFSKNRGSNRSRKQKSQIRCHFFLRSQIIRIIWRKSKPEKIP
jgi:hypothetical protein